MARQIKQNMRAARKGVKEIGEMLQQQPRISADILRPAPTGNNGNGDGKHADKEPWTEIITVTPEMAREFLTRAHPKQRKPRPGVIAKYVRAIQSGEWTLLTDSFGFDVNEYFTNGIHRCHAIIISGISIKVIVAHNLPARSYFNTDQGNTRAASDILGADKRLVEALKQLANIAYGVTNSTPLQIEPMLSTGLADAGTKLLQYCPGYCRFFSSAPVRAAALLTMVGRPDDEDYVLLMYRAFVHHDYGTLPKIGHALYRHIQRMGRANMERREALAKSFYVFDRDNAEIERITLGQDACNHRLSQIRSVLRDYLQLEDEPDAALVLGPEGQSNPEEAGELEAVDATQLAPKPAVPSRVQGSFEAMWK